MDAERPGPFSPGKVNEMDLVPSRRADWLNEVVLAGLGGIRKRQYRGGTTSGQGH